MTNGSTTNCTGTLYDSGGGLGNYTNNQTLTHSICPSAPNECVSLEFLAFNIEANWDFLYIYDSPTTAYPLIATYTGNITPATVQSTAGCLTLRFTSDGSITAFGWWAQWSCMACPQPCTGQSCNNGPPPANDECTNAQNLGTLPAPSNCDFGNGNGSPLTVSGSNLCATAANPYNSILDCTPSGDMASPALDVWYQFDITGSELEVDITNGMENPNIGLWVDFGGGCGSLTPMGCATGSSGTVSATFSPLVPGSYYLQVSGGDLNDECTFSLTLQNNTDCNICMTGQTASISPPPTNGQYAPGTSVTVCYEVYEYNQTNVNWLHGVELQMGDGWNASSVVPGTPPPPCDSGANRDWDYYNYNITGTANGITGGPGFYFDALSGGPYDGNPGNNYGDPDVGDGCSLEFCWTVTTNDDCGGGTDLTLIVETYGDSETGSWGPFACNNDPNFTFPASLQCCQPPTVSVDDVYICEGETANLAANASNDVISYLWSPGGAITQSISVSPTTTTSYTVTVQNNCNTETATGTVHVTPQPEITQMPEVDECVEGSFNIQSIVPDIVGTSLSGATFTFYGALPPNNDVSINEVTTINPPVTDKAYWLHVVQGTDPNACDVWELFEITLRPQPVLSAIPPVTECGEFDLSEILVSDANGLLLSGGIITYHQDGGGTALHPRHPIGDLLDNG